MSLNRMLHVAVASTNAYAGGNRQKKFFRPGDRFASKRSTTLIPPRDRREIDQKTETSIQIEKATITRHPRMRPRSLPAVASQPIITTAGKQHPQAIVREVYGDASSRRRVCPTPPAPPVPAPRRRQGLLRTRIRQRSVCVHIHHIPCFHHHAVRTSLLYRLIYTEDL